MRNYFRLNKFESLSQCLKDNYGRKIKAFYINAIWYIFIQCPYDAFKGNTESDSEIGKIYN